MNMWCSITSDRIYLPRCHIFCIKIISKTQKSTHCVHVLQSCLPRMIKTMKIKCLGWNDHKHLFEIEMPNPRTNNTINRSKKTILDGLSLSLDVRSFGWFVGWFYPCNCERQLCVGNAIVTMRTAMEEQVFHSGLLHLLLLSGLLHLLLLNSEKLGVFFYQILPWPGTSAETEKWDSASLMKRGRLDKLCFVYIVTPTETISLLLFYF